MGKTAHLSLSEHTPAGFRNSCCVFMSALPQFIHLFSTTSQAASHGAASSQGASLMHPSSLPPSPPLRAIFSDLDGTLVHFPCWFQKHGVQVISRDPEQSRMMVRSSRGEERICRMLPVSTMGDGIVSDRTVELV